MQRSRNRLGDALRTAGFAVLPGEGTYFLCVDLRASGIDGRDADLCRRLVAEAGVAAIPLSAFYGSDDAPDHLVRLCFAKHDDVLDAAAERLGAWHRR